MTEVQMQRTIREFSKAAGETVTIEDYGDEWTIFCSELGMYRINDKYTKVASKGYSKNLQTWYITIARGF